MRREPTTRRPLHVLLTTDVVGGVWDFCWVLTTELVRAGSRVTLLAFGSPSTDQRRQATAAGADLIDAPLKLEWMQDSAADVRAAVALTAQVIAELRPDILHANQYAPGQVRAGVPVVLTAHSDVLSWLKWTERGGRDGPIPIEWSRYAALVSAGLRAADAVIAVSGFMADELRELYRIRPSVSVIHNGWPAPTIAPRPIRERPRLTLLAGRVWDRAKNVGVAAWGAAGWEPGRVVLAGEQHHPESGNLAVVDPPIEALGRLPRQEIDRYLDRARVYLAPARYEPFGLLPVQAALAGCPLLLGDIPSFRELWGDAALFFRPDDPADLRRQWARILEDDALATDLAERARERARQRYDSARMAGAYASLYAKLLAGQAGVARAARWEQA